LPAATARALDDPDAGAAEHLVEGAGVLAVAVADQQADALVRQLEAEVACLLGHHAPVGLVEQPANQTRRLACAMKHNTEQRRRSTLSTMKKSQATMLAT
jgi:hypothetical protein